ncbi:hypothetical protein EVAR_27578_1 [Eumeta japonica]|uniref:Uncharacterized protein n=1 Tax=Eumeta variegata TaxID=151549 RepID=A0A4C1WAW6_EUMVA|nr:hypothetical protein EVAR_27578_1 [Eumeta japonica]
MRFGVVVKLFPDDKHLLIWHLVNDTRSLAAQGRAAAGGLPRPVREALRPRQAISACSSNAPAVILLFSYIISSVIINKSEDPLINFNKRGDSGRRARAPPSVVARVCRTTFAARNADWLVVFNLAFCVLSHVKSPPAAAGARAAGGCGARRPPAAHP